MAAKKATPNADNVNAAELRRRSLLGKYKAEPKVKMSISPLYEPYLGKIVQISINGITIAFPVNGSVNEVPESFANEITSRIMAIDAKIQKGKKMSDAASNSETYAGQIQMF